MSTQISKHLKENEIWYREQCTGCADIKFRPMCLGKETQQECLAIYQETAMGPVLLDLGITNMEPVDTLEEGLRAILAGDLLLLVDGLSEIYKVSNKGYPARSVSDSDTEKVLRGSNEGFTESVKVNTALIRKRIRSTGMKVEEILVGERSNTVISLVYMEDLMYPQVLEQLKQRLEQYRVDGVLDSGIIEQLTEKHWASPFPQYQTTQRPDLAALEILNGRLVVLCDNSPVALILPAAFRDFMNVSEDRYSRFEIVSFQRILRYLAVLLAVAFSGVYLAVINFHTQILPTNLLLSFAEARKGVPFPSLVEVLLMELAFEMIREAGVRMPGPLSGTIGIVGGLIIGDAAVSANLVSPMAVVVVALSALSSFAIPNEEFSEGFRLLKYGFILMGGLFGLVGIVAGVYLLLGHLAGLSSFEIPYLMPFTGKYVPGYVDENDGILRKPFRKMTHRPVYTMRDQRIRLRKKE